ncbi:SdiA-regulated domain-containing protein [Kistimonas asteriae]|uniref:SdiA-regulated domain-containing protein n=1 Tax=Kistimonas asteriae TaxID=517724 RepID=UPI001BAC9CB8|nr:SdiA-regulated domain-containing protein [Kistimonas asteriae]
MTKKNLILLAVILLGVFAVVQLDVDDRLYNWYLNKTTPETVRKDAIWLPNYQVVTEAKTLAGINNNASGVTWDPLTKTLFMVLNGPNQIIEISLDGDVIRRIPLEGFEDVEAIVWVGGDKFVIADERHQSLIKVTVTAETKVIVREDCPSFTLDMEAGDNKGFEGVAWDPKDDGIFVVRERDPMRLYKIHGLVGGKQPATMRVEKSEVLSEGAKAFSDDLSGLHFDPKTRHLLVLSHESRLLTEMDEQGNPVSFLELAHGWHGLKENVPQAEGITMDDAGNLYLISEPNLFYKFTRKAQGQ